MQSITNQHEALKTVRAQQAATIISRVLRKEYATHLAAPANRYAAPPNARENAGYYLTRVEPLADWSRDAPETHGYWGETRDWILRGLGRINDILEQWRTDREAEAILRDSIADARESAGAA